MRGESLPWKCGAINVIEVRMPNGEWRSFAAERMPEQLDDEIKKKKQEFYMAAKDLTLEKIKDLIPMTFPAAHSIPNFPLIAQYPVDQWEANGAPCFSKRSWYQLAMRVAMNDMQHLGEIFEMANINGKLEAKREEMAAKKPRLEASSTAASSSGERV